MSEKIYCNFLILCGIFLQGILGTFAEEIELSNFQIRNKRQVLSNRHAITPMSIKEIPYSVQILENNKYACVGNILLINVIITAAHCMEGQGRYHVLSGSEYVHKGIPHVIRDVLIHPEYHPNRYANDLALLYIHPEINEERSFNRIIKMHNGFIQPRTTGLVSGWGCIGPRDGEIRPNQLHAIIIPVISEERCRNIYMQSPHRHLIITDRDICTLDEIEGNKCGDGDSGAPLVIHNELVGIMSWNGHNIGPDVFMNLSYPPYRAWILENIPPHRYYPDSPHLVHHQRPIQL